MREPSNEFRMSDEEWKRQIAAEMQQDYEDSLEEDDLVLYLFSEIQTRVFSENLRFLLQIYFDYVDPPQEGDSGL